MSYPTESPPDPFVGGGSHSDVYPASANSGILFVISTHDVLKYCNIVGTLRAPPATESP